MVDKKADEAVKNTVNEVQKHMDEANDKGYFGETADPTPREHYTVAGVVAGKPTPETDDAAAAAAAKARG